MFHQKKWNDVPPAKRVTEHFKCSGYLHLEEFKFYWTKQIETFDTNGREMAKHYPQMVCNSHRQQRQKSNPTFTEITSALGAPRPCAPWGTLPTSCADTECVAGLKCSPGTVTPTLPTASFVPTARQGSSSLLPRTHPRRDKASVQIPQILAQVSLTSSQSSCSDCAAPCFSCSLLPSQSFSLLSALRPASFGGAGTRGVAVGI